MVWDFEEREEYYTSIDIQTAKDAVYKLEHLDKGFFWEESGFLFTEFVNHFYPLCQHNPRVKKVLHILYENSMDDETALPALQSKTFQIWMNL